MTVVEHWFELLFIHSGQPPNAADLHFLENAKKLAMYGVDIHPAQVREKKYLDTHESLLFWWTGFGKC